MRYLPGLILAIAFDATWIGCTALLAPDETMTHSRARVTTSAVLAPARVAPPSEGDTLTLNEISDIDRRVSALMLAIQQHGEDVETMRDLARLYTDNGWFEAAIGPLARAVELQPHDETLRKDLSRVLEHTGPIDLTAAARGFVETVEMWGHGC